MPNIKLAADAPAHESALRTLVSAPIGMQINLPLR